jgi:hypothetical protein
MRRFLAFAVLASSICALGCDRLRETPEYERMGDVVHSIPGFTQTAGLEIHAVRSSKTVIIHKIAVMPLIEEPDKIEGEMVQGAAEAVSAELYARASILGGWTLVPQDDVEAAMQQMPPTTVADMDQNALELGRKLGVDGVLYGALHRYRERVGYDYAAQSPAAVAFTLNFVDEKSKQVVWTAQFAKEQKALTEDVLDLPNFISDKARWVRAHDLAAEGAKEALVNLQSKVTVEPIVQGQY